MATQPMFDPTGQVRQIPADQATAALQAGGKAAVKVTDPTGTPRWIPADQAFAAIKAGGKLADAAPPAAPDDDTLSGQAQEAAQGFKKGINETGLTAMHVLHAIPGVGSLLDKTKFNDSLAETKQNADAPVDTIAGKTGYGVENIVEFMAGDELLKGLSLGEKLTKIAPMLKQLEKYPRLAKMVSAAVHQGTVGGVQAGVHGATPGEAATAGVITGVTGGAAEGAIPAAYDGVKSLISKLRPSTQEIAGETIPVLASQKPGAAPIAGKAATTADAPEVAAAQQEGGQQAVTNIAQRAAKDSLDRVNEVRKTAPIADPARMLQAPEGSKPFQFHIEGPPVEEGTEGSISQDPRKKQIGTEYVAGKGSGTAAKTEAYAEGTFKYGDEAALAAVSDAEPFAGKGHKEPVWQYLTASKPGSVGGSDVVGGGGRLVTSDPAAAQTALTRLEDLHDSAQFKALPKEQQQQITAARDSLQEQLGMYHAADRLNPHFDPVDTNAAIGQVSNFGEAADQVEASVKPIYQKLDEVSGGKFTALRNQAKAASKVMFQPGSVDAYEKALESKAAADQGIQDLFNRHSGSVSRPELQSANAAWRDATILNSIHATVEGAFRGAPKDIADTLGTNRLLRGNSLETRLNRMLQKTPRADVTRVIGQDGLENLYRVSDLLSKPETAVPTNSVARAIGLHLLQRTSHGAVIGGLLGHLVGHGFEGAVAGAAVEDATRYVLRQAAINPRIGMLVDRAVRHQVSPKIFAPLIAAEINSQRQPDGTEEGDAGSKKKLMPSNSAGAAPSESLDQTTAGGVPDFIKAATGQISTARSGKSGEQGQNYVEIAHVSNSDTNRIKVDDPARYDKATAAHEATHLYQNSRNDDFQAHTKVIEDPRLEDYDYGGEKGLNKPISAYNDEQQAQIVGDFVHAQQSLVHPKMTKAELEHWDEVKAKYERVVGQLADVPGRDSSLAGRVDHYLSERGLPFGLTRVKALISPEKMDAKPARIPNHISAALGHGEKSKLLEGIE